MDEKEQAKELNAKFKFDARSHGTGYALSEVHRFNAEAKASEDRARQNDMDGMASNRIMAGFKSGFGWRPNPRAGKRTVTSIVRRDGVEGRLEQAFYDGELVSETFTPYE